MWVAKDEVRIDAVDALARVRSRVRSRSPHLFGGRRAPATVFPTRLEEGVVVPDSDGIVGAVATALVTPFRGHRRRFFGRFARRERKRPALCVCCVGRGARLLSSHVSWGSCSGSGAFSFLVGLGALPSFSLSLSRAGGGRASKELILPLWALSGGAWPARGMHQPRLTCFCTTTRGFLQASEKTDHPLRSDISRLIALSRLTLYYLLSLFKFEINSFISDRAIQALSLNI